MNLPKDFRGRRYVVVARRRGCRKYDGITTACKTLEDALHKAGEAMISNPRYKRALVLLSDPWYDDSPIFELVRK